MTESPEQPPKQPSRLKRAAKAYSYVSDIFTPQRIGLFLAAGVLAVVGMFGGWGAAGDAAQDIPTAEVGEPGETTPFTVTPTRARVFDELGGVYYAEEGYRYIVVIMDVENTSAEFTSTTPLRQGTTLDVDGLRTLELDSGPKIVEPTVLRGADSLTQYTFQPGLPTNVVLAWQQHVESPIPDEITITFSDFSWRRSVMDDSMGWRDPTPAVTYVLPLEPLDEP